MTAWRDVSPVRDGEQIKAAIANRPVDALTDRTDFLKEQLNNAGLGQALIESDATIDPGCVVGMAVYYNSANARFEPGLAAAEVNSATGTLVAKDSADIIGVLCQKTNDTLGDILLLGRRQISGISSVIVGNNAVPGRYFLSADTPGFLINQTNRPAPGVPVLFLFPDDWVYVAPYVKDFVEEHVHYRFELFCRPAGNNVAPPPDADQRVTIDNPDADLAGWLPADHAIFEGTAPSGAVFGYNWRADPELSAAWPPVPVEAAQLWFDRDGNGATETPLGSGFLASIDENGIWWYSNCFNDTPWPGDYSGPTSLTTSLSSTAPECPRTRKMRMYLAYARMTYLTAPNVVTKLTHATGSPIQVLDRRGQPGATGELFLNYSDAAALRTYLFQEGQIDNVTKLFIQSLPYYSFAAGQKSALWGRFVVPDHNLPLGPKLKLQLLILGRANGTLPQLEITYLRLPIPQAGGASLALDANWQAVPINTVNNILTDRYVLAESDGFEIGVGDEVHVQIRRANNDSYGGELGLMSIKAVILGS